MEFVNTRISREEATLKNTVHKILIFGKNSNKIIDDKTKKIYIFVSFNERLILFSGGSRFYANR
jgi:hypothetical protein